MSEKKWVWLDVDDVLTQTSVSMHDSITRWGGRFIPMEQWPSHRFSDIYGLPLEAEKQLRAMWKEDRVLERALLYPGVLEAMKQLHEAGIAIGLITARSWHEKGRVITQRMIDEHQMPVSELIVLDPRDSKSELLEQTKTHIVGFLDDTPRHVVDCLDKGYPGMVMNRPWNQEVPRPLPRVNDIQTFATSVIATVLSHQQGPGWRQGGLKKSKLG